MTTRKRFEITIESERLLIIRRRYSTRLWCRECGHDADFVPLEQIVPMEQARQLMETVGKVPQSGTAVSLHVRETHDGPALVCLASVMALWAQEERKTRAKPE